MGLTVDVIRDATTDRVLCDLLTAELDRQLPPHLLVDRSGFLPPTGTWLMFNKYVALLRDLPAGLRAMATTCRLDSSMEGEDLGWHFCNWHHLGYCDQTSEGLWELGAWEAAQIFDQAYRLFLPHWDMMDELVAAGVNELNRWYWASPLNDALRPLNGRLWEICEESEEFRLMRFSLQYARRHPERVATESG